MTVEINGVPFDPVPGIAYVHDYVKLAERIASWGMGADGIRRGKWFDDTDCDELGVYRQFILGDLWFVLYFVVKPWANDAGRQVVNSPFVVNVCREVERGPKDFTLDVWARFHYKSAILTIAETIQQAVTNPNESTGIFSFKASVAKNFLFSIKQTFERERILSKCFPESVWQDCQKEAPMWSVDGGLVLRRESNRKEPNIGAYGLIEGMPTGLHFENMVYDDIVTEDICRSLDVMADVKQKFDSSRNMRSIVGSRHRVIGTYYHHSDPLIYIREKKVTDDAGAKKPLYLLRLKPATADGKPMGRPVLMEAKDLASMRGDPGTPAAHTFNCQQMLDPTPEGEQELNPKFLTPVEPQFIPKDLFRLMLIDQAGDQDAALKRDGGDSWAVAVVGVEPVEDKSGQPRVFIEDLWIQPAGASEAIDKIVQMYLFGGMIERLCVEKVGISTTHLHIAQALKARGRHINFEDRGNGILLRPAGRNKKQFISGALAWPLNNGKLFYSTEVPTPYIERLKMEMENFPLWHDDALNVLAYVYDVIKDVRLSFRGADEPDEDESNVVPLRSQGASVVGGY
jgi:hypothetical protein